MKLKGLILSAIALFSMTTVLSAAKTMRVSLQLPISHSLGENWKEFKSIVEKETNGEIKVIIFPSAQLYKDKQVPEAVGTGAIEAGTAFMGRFTGSVPAADVVSLPFFFKDEKSLRAAVKNGSHMRNILDAAILKETGAKVLWWQAYGRNIYLNNGKPVRTPSDLKGKKVRTYGKILSWTVEEAGGVPTIMSGSKQFLAYQQHAVDVGLTGLSAVESRKLYEVMKNVTLTYDSIIEFVAIINNKFFNSLSPKNQKIILKAASIVETNLRDKVYNDEEALVKRIESKMNVIKLTPDERKQWQSIAKPVLEKYRAEVGPLADEVIKAARADEAGM